MTLSTDDIAKIIQSEIYENNESYKKSYNGSIQQMLNALDAYVFKRDWSQSIGDIAVFAAANCLHMNLCIFKNINNRALLYFVQSVTPSDRDVYLKYDHEHYDAIVWKGDECMSDPIDAKTREYFRRNGIYFTHDVDSKMNPPTKLQNSKNATPTTSTPSEMRTPKTQKPTIQDIGSDIDEDTFNLTNDEQSSKSNNSKHGPVPDTVQSGTRDKFPKPFTQYASSQKCTSYGEDYEEAPNREPVPDKYQFEETYSGNEVAVLNNSQLSGSDIEIEDTPQITSRITVSDVNSDSMSSSVFSDSSSTSTCCVRPRKYSKNKIDQERMARCEVENVTTMPWDVNGDHVYEVAVTQNNYIDKYRDGWWFVLKNSSRRGFKGIRKTGCCRGSLICRENKCPKLTSEGVVNTSAFIRIGGSKYECGSCGHIAERTYCGAIKSIELDIDAGRMRIQHQGEHVCSNRPNVAERRKVLDDLPIPMSGSTKAKKFLHECFTHCLANDEVERAFEMCDEVSEVDLRDRIKKMRMYPNKSVARHDICESFLNIAHIQSSIKKSGNDKYLLYQWECEGLGGSGTYVFKTSEVCLEIALKMAGEIKIGDEDSSLMEEPAYFNGMHKRVRDFVMLTLWVFHPGMRMMNILAVMECPKEDTFNIVIFFKTFNKALGEYLGDTDYTWNPFLLMMDEKGANYEAITLVFGENFMKTKTVSCQWHFKNCAEKYLVEVPLDERKSFRRYCDELCEAYTRKHYREVQKLILEIVEKYKFMGWWKFWCPRGQHIVPALRGFNLPKMNLAEVGQSTMRAYRKIWLTEGAFADIAALAFQSSNYKKFKQNKEKIMGRGPTLKKRNAREKATERRFLSQIDDVLYRGDLEAEGEKQVGQVFTPSKKAKHRAPKNPKKGRQGQEDDVIIIDAPAATPKRKKNPQRPGRGTNRKFDQNPIQLNPANDYAEELKAMVPDAFEKDFLTANRVYYVVLKKNNVISRCRGCNMAITKEDKQPPKNMVFLHKLRREIPPSGGKGQWVYSPDRRNCYFHADDLGCLKRIFDLTEITPDHLYMSNENFKRLTKENIEVLEQRDHWESIIENRCSVRLTGRLRKEYT